MESTWKAVTRTILLLSLVLLPATVVADPITIDFNKCQASQYQAFTDPSVVQTINCCPLVPSPSQPIVDGLPSPNTSYIRTRLAAQCTDAAYAAKLDRAYQLMRALPDDDPRSFTQQWYLHCSYCGGAFYQTDNSTGIDIHFSWLFFPWHRFYLYFHERILQSLLGDPSFSLSYWNWDSPFTFPNTGNGACSQAGHNFPTAYANSTSSTYDRNRSQSAMGLGRFNFPDLGIGPDGTNPNVPANASADQVIQSNLNLVYNNMVSGATTAETFMGRTYSAGDIRGNPQLGGGSLELGAHAGPHFWTGLGLPTNEDMGDLAYSARDPVFFAHHSNIDRLFKVWKDIGPTLGQNRQYYSDPDFLNATFLFYDENKTLRRVKIQDALTTEGLGYTYQAANDFVWLYSQSTKCSSLNYTDLINQASSLPTPVKQSDGYYHLQAGTTFTIIVDQPAVSNGTDQFLIIESIKMNRLLNGAFDVFLDLLHPENYTLSTACSEYLGRFMNMRRSRDTNDTNSLLTWKQSISETLTSINAPAPPTQVVVSIRPLSRRGGTETITFSNVTITS